LLAAHRDLHDQRRSFLTSVSDYNEQIAEYALSVAGPRLDPPTVVAMLIEAQVADRSVLVPARGVQPAAAQQTLQPPASPAATEQPLQPVPPAAINTGKPSPFRDVTP
jgi:hypothetical protein